MLDILIGTNNKFKIEEMQWLLKGLGGVKIHYLDEIRNVPEVEEDGKTLLDNANKKSIQISKLTDYLVFTSDAGIKIPGIKKGWDYRKPQRILGVKATAQEKINKLMGLMEGLIGEERGAQYILAISLAHKGVVLYGDEFVGSEGVITLPELVKTGDLDPVRAMSRMWFLKEFGRTEEMLTEKERSKIRVKYQTNHKSKFQEFIKSIPV